MSECVFCNPDELTESTKLRKSKQFNLLLDPFPVNFGHLLIISERHVQKVDRLGNNEMQNLREMIKDAKEAVEKYEEVKEQYFSILKAGNRKSEEMIKGVIEEEKAPDGFNIGINEGEESGQTIEHLHIHVTPRYEGDIEFPEGGIRNVIPEKADYTGEDE
jgi:diadenosine tetraphosphate (Ap4A) HIT family hydrolase